MFKYNYFDFGYTVEDSKNLPSNKGLEYNHPFDTEQNISPNSDYEIISEK